MKIGSCGCQLECEWDTKRTGIGDYTTYLRGVRWSVEIVRAELAGHGNLHFLWLQRNSELQKSVMSLEKVGADVCVFDLTVAAN
jgi:hypothetical protein